MKDTKYILIGTCTICECGDILCTDPIFKKSQKTPVYSLFKIKLLTETINFILDYYITRNDSDTITCSQYAFPACSVYLIAFTIQYNSVCKVKTSKHACSGSHMERPDCIYQSTISLGDRWRKSDCLNCLWQVHLSISQLPTSVTVGRNAANWHSFCICIMSCTLCTSVL